MVISLTTTPMMCALLLRLPGARPARRSLLDRSIAWYERTLGWSLRHGVWVMLALAVTVALNVLLFTIIPKAFFRRRIPGSSPAASSPTRASRSS